MKLLTTKDAADRLGVSVARVYQFISEERLPAQKVGRDYLIDETDLRLVKDRKPGRPAKKGKQSERSKPKRARDKRR